jgi:hypothetical protein
LTPRLPSLYLSGDGAPGMDPDSIKTGLKWFGAGAGTFIPAMTYFTGHAPPLFSGITSILAAFGGALIIVAFLVSKRETRRADLIRKDGRKGLFLIVAALVLLILYTIGLHYTTVVDPNENGRLQTGFGLSKWTLTPQGAAWLEARPGITAGEMVLFEAAFDQGMLSRLWRSWSIYLAGSVMIIIYLCAFSLWTFGFSILAKYSRKAPAR